MSEHKIAVSTNTDLDELTRPIISVRNCQFGDQGPYIEIKTCDCSRVLKSISNILQAEAAHLDKKATVGTDQECALRDAKREIYRKLSEIIKTTLIGSGR